MPEDQAQGTAPTIAELSEYVGAGASDAAQLGANLATAVELVTMAIGSASVPAPVQREAVMQTAAAIFHRRQAPNGIADFGEAGPVRVSRDPMLAARPILAPYIAGGFA